MPGAVIPMKKPRKARRVETMVIDPERALSLLEMNKQNRPLSHPLIARIARQITAGLWRFNGDTIKMGESGDIIDGQHRLWACVEAGQPIETLVVYGVARDAFSTIDTLGKQRSTSDTLHTNGLTRYRVPTSTALSWLIRWQRDRIKSWKAPINRVENSDIEAAFVENPGIERAVERVYPVRTVANCGVLAFLYYILTNRDEDLAERFVETLLNPARVALNDPFYVLRTFYMGERDQRRRNPLITIAVSFKAINAAAKKKKVGAFSWKNQGANPEKFPVLDV